jgi:MHS family alpha-ketoglutarate permease-like MFS transporter
MFFTYVTAAIFISLLVYIFALKNKKATHLDTEQGHAWDNRKDDDKKDLVNV